MSRITKQDTNGVKPLLSTGELGYDNYPTGGDVGRVYVGTGAANIALAKKTEVTAVDTKADTHIGRVDNPHNVTKSQVGLANVDNTADSAKPVSIAQATAIGLKADSLTVSSHTGNISNPHSVTKAQVGLGNVDNTSDASKPVSTAQQTALNLKANLDSPTFTGLVTASGTVEVTGVSGGPTLTIKNGGDFRIQNYDNTAGVTTYCDVNGVLTVAGELRPTVGTANVVSNATVITVNTITPTVIASCTITTKGYPVLLVATGDQNPNQAGGWHYVQFAINDIAIGKLIINENAGGNSKNCPFALTTIHHPPAGTHTFQVRAWQGSGSMTYGESGDVHAPTIVAVELR